jgi:hypothetical protein
MENHGRSTRPCQQLAFHKDEFPVLAAKKPSTVGTREGNAAIDKLSTYILVR